MSRLRAIQYAEEMPLYHPEEVSFDLREGLNLRNICDENGIEYSEMQFDIQINGQDVEQPMTICAMFINDDTGRVFALEQADEMDLPDGETDRISVYLYETTTQATRDAYREFMDIFGFSEDEVAYKSEALTTWGYVEEQVRQARESGDLEPPALH